MRELLPVLLVLLGLLVLATATSVGVVWWLSGGGPSQQAAVILVYEVDPSAGIDPLDVDMQEVVRVLDRRINPTWTPRARITVGNDRRVEIGIFEDDPDVEQLVVDRVERVGSLELRVLAHFSADGRLIGRAVQSSAAMVTDAAGQVDARWVPVASGEEAQFQGDPEIALRPGRDAWEVLVLHDRFNVTGNYLQDASAAVDDQGNPCISFTLDNAGGDLLAQLTGSNQPNFATGMTRRLGVILSGQLHSAPAIQSTIHRQGMITGSFSEAETLQLSETLRGGPLPAPLKRVERRVPMPQE
jgi:preprotein translocase subunit SecD